MKKTIDHVLKFRSKGEDRYLTVSVDFVSNWVMREYNNILQIINDTQTKWNSIVEAMKKREALLAEMPEGFSAQLDVLDKEIRGHTEAIKKNGEGDIFQKRFEVIKTILEDNGVKEEILYDYNFWDRCVEPSEMNEFLEACAWKDIDKKKVV